MNEVVEQIAVVTDDVGEQDTINDDVLNNDADAGAMPEADAETQESQEAVAPKGQPTPSTPTAEEVANHNMTHLPYRSWCPQCVRGRGKASPHKAHDSHRAAGVPVLSIDYTFLCVTEKETRDAEDAENDPIHSITGKKLQPLLVLFIKMEERRVLRGYVGF